MGLCDVDAPSGAAVARDIERAGGRALFVETDVADSDAVRRFVDRVAGTFGGVNVLVNNAGVSSPRASVQDLAEAEWHRVLGVNLHGHFYAAKYAVPHLLRAGGGAIVNTASVLGQATLPGGVAYSTSKAALIGFTKSLAHDLGPSRIRVNCLLPGSTDTPMMWEGVAPGGPRGRGGRGRGEPAAPARGPARGDRAGRAVPGERCGLVRHGSGRRRRRGPPRPDRDDTVTRGLPVTGGTDGQRWNRPPAAGA